MIDVYKLTKDNLEQARLKTLEHLTNKIKEKSEEYLKLLTGNRYTKLQLNLDEKKKLQIHISHNTSILTPEELSVGTADQLYLAIRFALLDTISWAKPPIILDDPLVNFDSERLEYTHNLLKHLSNEYQIFIFTCHNTHNSIANHIIELK